MWARKFKKILGQKKKFREKNSGQKKLGKINKVKKNQAYKIGPKNIRPKTNFYKINQAQKKLGFKN